MPGQEQQPSESTRLPSLREIVILFIAQEDQRYNTQGDWEDLGDTIVIKSSGDTEHERFLIALHELVEAYICRCRGITTQDVDNFDLTYTGDGEPGDHPDSPYRVEHRQAMLIEHLVAHFLGLVNYGEVR